MAREFETRCASRSGLSRTELKVKIGLKEGLKRAAAIEAVNAGLQILFGKRAKLDA